MHVFHRKTRRLHFRVLAICSLSCGLASFPAAADVFSFSTGSPDGLMASVSRVASAGKLETETADDFVTTQPTTFITNATFTGLLPLGTPLSALSQVEIELYHVFPVDSTFPPDNRVTTRVNSPSDNNFAAADSALGQLTFTTKLINPDFTAANSVVNNIFPAPQFTGGQGAVMGEEVEVDVNFIVPFILGADHVFFRPEVGLTGSTGDFLWLSAPKPILPPGTPFAADLQTWTRDDGPGALAPDWSRIGTDITHQGPFNASFSLTGTTVPEPSAFVLLATAVLGFGIIQRRRKS
jgi:hypothetical protein